MNLKQTYYWLRDRVYPSPEGIKPRFSIVKNDWILKEPPSGEPLNIACSWLKDQVKAEEDRGKIVEGKLQSVLPLSSTVITLLLALITFLTSGKAGQYTKSSILLVTLGCAYVATQFLVAFFRAIRGLARQSYDRADVDDIAPQPSDNKDTYIRRAFSRLAEILQHNTETNNDKVTQLACAHEALKNGVVGLLIVIIILLFITTYGQIG